MKNILRIVFGILFVVSIYLIPTGIAMLRRVRNAGSIAALNVLLGWTLLVWAITLAMAVRSKDIRPAVEQS